MEMYPIFFHTQTQRSQPVAEAFQSKIVPLLVLQIIRN
jgi:hypothetical protein